MGNIIIVEGIDRVGKTTLCNLLLKELKDFKLVKYDSQIIQCRDRQNNYETDKSLLTLEMCKIFDGSTLFDRLHLSDYVYGIMQRNYNKQNAYKNFQLIENYINQNFENAILIFVKPTDIKKSSEEHGRNLYWHEMWFEDIFKLSKIKNKISCNYNTLDDAITFVKDTNIKRC
jgi:thymidylate kinase